MSDVVEGRQAPRRRPLRLGLIAGVCVLAVVSAAVYLTGSGGRRHQDSSPSPVVVTPNPPPTPTPIPSAASSRAAPSSSRSSTALVLPWPSASAACGGTVYLPQLSVGSGPAGFVGELLVGGSRLWQVSAPGNVAQLAPVAGLPTLDGSVEQLVAGPAAFYAQLAGCETAGFAGPSYRVSGGVATRLPINGEVTLMGGVHHAWGLSEASPGASGGDPAAGPTLMTPLDGGPPVTLPPYTDLVADTPAGLVVSHYDPVNSYVPPSLEVLDPSSGAVRYPLVSGNAYGVVSNLVMVQTGTCATPPQAAPCVVAEVDAASGTTLRTFTLPLNRLIVSEMAFSVDGGHAAFLLSRAGPDPRFATGHPFGPDDVAVLDVGTGRLSIVPGIELASKTSAGLAFDSAGQLLIALSEGTHGDLLGWQPGASMTKRVATIPGAIANAPFLLRLPAKP